MVRKVLIVLLILLVIIQFFRPERNESNDLTYDISTKYEVPAEVNELLKVSCNDCHSNKTEYPWYANVQPVAWWLNEHIVKNISIILNSLKNPFLSKTIN